MGSQSGCRIHKYIATLTFAQCRCYTKTGSVGMEHGSSLVLTLPNTQTPPDPRAFVLTVTSAQGYCVRSGISIHILKVSAHCFLHFISLVQMLLKGHGSVQYGVCEKHGSQDSGCAMLFLGARLSMHSSDGQTASHPVQTFMEEHCMHGVGIQSCLSCSHAPLHHTVQQQPF